MRKSDTCERQNKKNRSLESEKKNWLFIAISGSGMMEVYQLGSAVKNRSTCNQTAKSALEVFFPDTRTGYVRSLPDTQEFHHYSEWEQACQNNQ